MLDFIEERLSELEKEKEELTEYEQLDKHRRALEYNLYDKELVKANEMLGRIEVEREGDSEKLQALHARLREIQDDLQQEEEALSTVRLMLDRLVTRKAEKAADVAETLKRRTAIEVELQETEVCIWCMYMHVLQITILYLVCKIIIIIFLLPVFVSLSSHNAFLFQPFSPFLFLTLSI